ncbi:MAG: ABC transporter ATP-binding protein [Desulfobacteraceae bacterium]|nr:ABC transporter ATP-binding protein [Desulfobacteraceae bacterium]
MRSQPPFIQASNLGFAYGRDERRPVLSDIALQAGEDRYLLIGGASGSGKSTLCRTFNGLIPHFYNGRLVGRVVVGGLDTRTLSVGRLFDRVGMVFQNPEAQLFNRTVAREIAFGLESLRLKRDDIRQRIAEAAIAAGIEDQLERFPHHLSGGEQHLTAVAAILALRPRVLIFDEPFANLDPLATARLRRVLAGIGARGDSRLIVCEHRLALTAPDAERMIVVCDGRIVADGKPAAVLSGDVRPWALDPPLAAVASVRLGLMPTMLDMEKLPLDGDAKRRLDDLLPNPPAAGRGDDVLLAVENLCVHRRQRPVLRDVSFELRRGEVAALVGANGAGKTTLVRHLNGLVRPGKGRVVVCGRDTRRVPTSTLARQVGFVFQNPDSQFFKLTVADEIRVGPRALGIEAEDWMALLARRLGLTALMHRAPFRLSGGEKKRVAVAAALASRPELLVLDEPTAGQDLFFRQALGNLLLGLADEGRAVLMVTHDLGFAERYAARWLVLGGGTIAADDSPARIMADAALMQRCGLMPTEAFRLKTRLEAAGHA